VLRRRSRTRGEAASGFAQGNAVGIVEDDEAFAAAMAGDAGVPSAMGTDETGQVVGAGGLDDPGITAILMTRLGRRDLWQWPPVCHPLRLDFIAHHDCLQADTVDQESRASKNRELPVLFLCLVRQISP
jgi:hypothetical protein